MFDTRIKILSARQMPF